MHCMSLGYILLIRNIKEINSAVISSVVSEDILFRTKHSKNLRTGKTKKKCHFLAIQIQFGKKN